MSALNKAQLSSGDTDHLMQYVTLYEEALAAKRNRADQAQSIAALLSRQVPLTDEFRAEENSRLTPIVGTIGSQDCIFYPGVGPR